MLLFQGLPVSQENDTDDHQTMLPETYQGAALPSDEAALLRQSLDHLRHVFWVATWPEKRLLYANQEFEKVWGISPEVATHEPDRLTTVIHPDDRAGWIAAHTNPNGSDTEYRLCRPDGRVRWLRESIFPIRDAAGRPFRLVGLAKDITAYKRLGDAIRESEERFRKFFDLNPSPSCIFSARTGKVVEINTAFEELTGYTRHEVLGQSLGKLNLWLDPTLPALVLHALRQKATPQAFDTTIQTRTGKIRDVTVAANLVTIGGRPCVVAVATDLTEFNDLRRQLTESEARFRSLVENAPDILICTTLDGEVTYLNHAELDCQESLLLGHNLLDYATEANAIRAAMRDVMATGQATSFEAQFRFTEEHPRWCAGRVAPIRCGENITELLFRLRDIQDRKAAELELQKLYAEIAEANTKLRELDRLKARFAAMLVHDLRSPLGCVYSALELFETVGKTDDDTRHLIGVARNSLERALNLLNEVQEVYRSEETGITLNRTSFDVAALLQEVMDDIRPEADRKNITLKYELSDASSLPPLLADRSKLLRVISNLLTNAVKFTSKGGVVMLNTAVVNGMGVNIGRDFIEISVTDTGIGIPPEDLPYVFDVYRQSRNNRSGVGVGLGLSIVKSIVAAHGGDVRVESQPGVGTSFTVSLPISAVDETPEALPPDRDQTPNPTAAGPTAAGTGPTN